MNRIVIVSILCLSLCSIGLAQQDPADVPATKADVEKYLQAIHSHEMMKQMVQAMSAPMHKMIHDQFLEYQDKLPPDFEERMNASMDDMMAKMPWDEILQSMIPSYQKHFTKGEVDALVAFYSSPTGQKILRELPAVAAESMEAMMPLLRKQMEGIADRIQQQMGEMVKQPQKGKTGAATQN